jgi:PAS domain S-box-containing protein
MDEATAEVARLQARVRERTAETAELRSRLELQGQGGAEGVALERALQLTQAAVDNAAETMLTLSPEGRILAVNVTACWRLGYAREEFQCLHVWDLWDVAPGQGQALWAEQFWQPVRRAGTTVVQTRHRARGGRTFPVEVSAWPSARDSTRTGPGGRRWGRRAKALPCWVA